MDAALSPARAAPSAPSSFHCNHQINRCNAQKSSKQLAAQNLCLPIPLSCVPELATLQSELAFQGLTGVLPLSSPNNEPREPPTAPAAELWRGRSRARARAGARRPLSASVAAKHSSVASVAVRLGMAAGGKSGGGLMNTPAPVRVEITRHPYPPPMSGLQSPTPVGNGYPTGHPHPPPPEPRSGSTGDAFAGSSDDQYGGSHGRGRRPGRGLTKDAVAAWVGAHARARTSGGLDRVARG
jgi:hypothetical protein